MDLASALAAFYGPLVQPPSDPFGAYVWEVLGMKTTPARRESALAALRRIPAMTPDSMRKLGRGRLETVVRLCGPFVDERLSALETGVDVFRRRRNLPEQLQGSLRTAWLALRDLPHLGDGASARLLLFASPHTIVPVDAPLARLAVRLGLIAPVENPRRLTRSARRAFRRVLPVEHAALRRAIVYLNHHTQNTCVDFDPHCTICPIAAECPEGMRRAQQKGPVA
jgi:endonuclease III